MLVDSCVGVAECQASSTVPGSSRFLNLAAPLQLGGSAVPLDRVQALVSWDATPGWAGFTGCIQNMTFLDRVCPEKMTLLDRTYPEKMTLPDRVFLLCPS